MIAPPVMQPPTQTASASLISPAPTPDPSVMPPPKPDDMKESEKAEVKKWLRRIEADKKKFKPDFDDMRKAMEFVYGYQWPSQDRLDTDLYTNNITLRMVNQKVANLYARNPKATVSRRDQMDFIVWDGDLTQLQSAMQRVEQGLQMGMPPIEDIALIQDYQQGMQRRKVTDRICETAEKVYQYCVDTHDPEFKEQMKQLVRRVIISRVGYVKVRLCRNDYAETFLSTVTTPNDVRFRMDKARSIAEGIQKGEILNDGAQAQEVVSLLKSVAMAPDDSYVGQYLEFDFPTSLSIIPSSRCRSIKEWIAADYITQQYCVPLSIVNALFDTEINPGGQIKEVASESDSMPPAGEERSWNQGGDPRDPDVYLYEVFNREQKTHFFLLEGYEGWVVAPEPMDPDIRGYWNIFGLTFNDTEALPEGKASIFPPSDVELVIHPQREWNRSRDAMRDHRNASQPRYMCRKGILSEQDLEAIRNCKANNIAELADVLPEQKLTEVFVAMPTVPIDERLYDVIPLSYDMQMSIGLQEANFGSAQPNVTATVGTIAEQSRLTVSSSNVDDLDGLLTRVARASIEMCFRCMSPQTVKQIVGPGAAWPTLDLEDYLNEIDIKIVAASSGRPNQAIDQQKFQTIAPLLLQAGANPVGVVEWGARIMELDVTPFFPLNIPNMQNTLGGIAQGQDPTSATVQGGQGNMLAAQGQESAPPGVGKPSPQKAIAMMSQGGGTQ